MKRVMALLLAVGMLFSMAGCTAAKRDKVDINVMAMKGPTGMGMSLVKEKADAGELEDNVKVDIVGMPEEVTAALINKEVDIAAVPVNLASVLYNRTEGGVQMLGVNALGMLYVVETGGSTIQSLQDLEGKTVYSSGLGSTPEYAFNSVLEQAGVNCNVEYKTDHTELATLVASGNVPIAVLPEPFLTTVLSKNDQVRIAIDLNKAWKDAAQTDLVLGCIVVRTEFAKENPEAVAAFMEAYEQSVEYVNGQPAEAAKLIDIPVTIGMECRVSMAGTRLEGRRTNNPDQVGVSYMTIQSVPHDKIATLTEFFKPYQAARHARNRQMIVKINEMVGVSLDYDRDVLPLSEAQDNGGVT
ncbi:MAG: ABC transporter substrate-binding protein, partial [Clostridia bacterium]|nr:ABC transporter substrate-binding protein [Clostridia bacterium]